MRPLFLLVFVIQLIALGLALTFFYALIFQPELMGETVARIINGFRQAI